MRAFTTSEQAADIIIEYSLLYSKENHGLPRKKEVEGHFRTDLRTYGLNWKNLKKKMVSRRVDEIFRSNPDITLKELVAELGISDAFILSSLGYKSFSELRYVKTRKESRRKLPIFETSKQAYHSFFKYCLNQSKQNHRIPRIEEIQNFFKTDLRSYDLKWKSILLKVIEQRLKEIYKEFGDVTAKRTNNELGIGIFNYLKDLGYDSFSDLRYAITGKRTRRKFDTREKALDAFRSKVREKIIDGSYTCQWHTEREVGTPASIYGIKWREDVLDFVYDAFIIQDLKQNPRQSEKELREKYSFSVLSFFDRKGGFRKYKKERGILYKSHSNREELLENSAKAFKILSDQGRKVTLQNIVETVGAPLSYWDITKEDIYKKAEIPYVSESDLKSVDSMLNQFLSSGPKFSYEILKELNKKIPSALPSNIKKNLFYHGEHVLKRSVEGKGPFLSVITYSPRGKRTKLYSLKKHKKTLNSRKKDLDKKFKIGNRGLSRISAEIIEFIFSRGPTSNREVFEYLFKKYPQLLKKYKKPNLFPSI